MGRAENLNSNRIVIFQKKCKKSISIVKVFFKTIIERFVGSRKELP